MFTSVKEVGFNKRKISRFHANELTISQFIKIAKNHKVEFVNVLFSMLHIVVREDRIPRAGATLNIYKDKGKIRITEREDINRNGIIQSSLRDESGCEWNFSMRTYSRSMLNCIFCGKYNATMNCVLSHNGALCSAINYSFCFGCLTGSIITRNFILNILQFRLGYNDQSSYVRLLPYEIILKIIAIFI